MTDQELFDQAPCGYVLLDEALRIVRVNVAFLRLVGLARDEVIGLSLPQLLPAGGSVYCETHLRPALELHGELHEVALELTGSAGERIPVLVSANRDEHTIRLIVFEARHRRTFETNLLHLTQEAERARAAAVEMAQTLQRTLIPPKLPAVPGLDIAAAYRPAGDGSVVGGDFYDVFQLATNAWSVVVGDVEGKGVSAAAVTAFARHQLRGICMQRDDPAEVLHLLNRALIAHQSEHFCTLALLRLDSTRGRWRARTSLGGHPRPLLRRAGADVEQIGTPGPIVGIFDDPAFSTVEHDLPGTTLTLFTDGVTDARSGPAYYGEERLIELMRAHPSSDADSLTTRIVDDVLSFQAGRAVDDIAVVTITTPADD